MTRWRIILSVVFALLLVGVVASWSRSTVALDMASYRMGTLLAPGEDAQDPAKWTYESRAIGINHRRGLIGLVWTRHKNTAESRGETEEWLETQGLHSVTVAISLIRPAGERKWARYESATNWNLMSLGMSASLRQGQSSWTMDVPHWMPVVVLTIALGAVVGKPFIRRRRGRCPWCGYDIRGQADKGCSECGWRRPGRARAKSAEVAVTAASS